MMVAVINDHHPDPSRTGVVKVVWVASDLVCLGAAKVLVGNEAALMVGTWLVQVGPMLVPTTDEVGLVNMWMLPDADDGDRPLVTQTNHSLTLHHYFLLLLL